jgi:hypothetical protein
MPPTKPTVILDQHLLPTQLSGTADVGPAYRSFEEAFQNKAHARCHIAEVILFDRSRTEVARWWEVSQSLGVKGVGRAGDTEQKALVRVNLKPGYLLEIRGAYNPCPVRAGCDLAMQEVATRSKAEIVYRTYQGKSGTVHHYPKDDF